MKKIININFHSRVIPIEETAYDILRKYVDSLKKHFANEEGGDEIVNDIEDRFAELFSDRLKKGATCITDSDVEEIILSMGRPEDFDQDEKTESNTSGRQTSSFAEETPGDEPRRLYRSENDKMLGGVCGGIAAYLKIDPSFVRILYAILILVSFGTALVVYFALWIVLPPKSMVTKIRKRLFRDPDHRVIGGVASGVAAYFNTEAWIFRLIFCAPLIMGIIRSIFRHGWFDFDGPVSFVANGFGGGLFTLYIILWIVLPEAVTASEKLEMRGEKIDLESIKNTIKSDLEGFKQKASVVGSEMKSKAEQFGSEFKNRSGNVRRDISSVNIPRRGIGHAIGVLFKAFFLFISVCVAFSLVGVLIAFAVTGVGLLPLKNYFVAGFGQNVMLWCVLILFVLLPVVGLLTWLIRRIIGARRGHTSLGYVFGSLWTIGLICLIFLTASISSNFKVRNGVKDDIYFHSPTSEKLMVTMDDTRPVFSDNDDWLGFDMRHDAPFFDISDDSVTINTVRIDVIKSKDSTWHIQRERLSRGNTSAIAQNLAEQINFPIEQRDSTLVLARGFSITPGQQFHNQQVLVVVAMPVGKKIIMNKNLTNYHWFNLKGHNNGFNINVEYNDDDISSWDTEVEYVMTESGLERTSSQLQKDKRLEKEDDNNDDNGGKTEAVPDSIQKKTDNPKGDFRYHKAKTASANGHIPESSLIQNGDLDAGAALIMLTRLS